MLLFYYRIVYAYDDVCDVRVVCVTEELRSCYYHIEVHSGLYLYSRRSYIGVGHYDSSAKIEYVLMSRATYSDFEERSVVG